MLRRLGIDLQSPKSLKVKLARKTSSTFCSEQLHIFYVSYLVAVSKLCYRLENACLHDAIGFFKKKKKLILSEEDA